MPPSTAAPASATAAARARTVRIFVDGPGRRVLFAEAGADVAAFLSSLLAAPVRAAAADILREDPASAAAACCFGNLAAASDALLPRVHAASSSRAPAGMGIMARRLFRCGHLGCPCNDVASREPGSACPCASRSCRAAAAGGTGTRDTELHFLEACFYRRPDGSAAGRSRGGGGRSGDTFYRCRARDERRGGAGRDVFPCRFRVTDERGVECPLCGGRTTVEIKCAAKAGGEVDAQDGGPTTTCYAIMDDLSVRPVAAGLSGSALLSGLGVAADPDDVREETVPFGYKEGFNLLWAALRSKTALTDVFLPAVTPAARRRRR
ncbi:unnamed protein product [Urochloa decumbens]|uniref:Uncharacterized protein n=1 Tax=Urochloa decumbens TaxID=240449 RepID=A0ABC8Z9W5_9POAL